MTESLHLVARIAGRTVAIPSLAVESVVDLDTIVPVPRAAPGVVGIAALRSRVLTVVDPCIALGGALAGEARRAAVVRVDGHHYAVVADAIDDVAEHAVSPLPPGLALDGCWARAARGLIDLDGEPARVVDPAALLPALT